MTSAANSIRPLLVYGLILPMALILGYLIATPTDFGTWATVLMIFAVICAPLILAYHHAVLFLSWNMTACVFFIPGRPHLWLVIAALGLIISILQRTLSKEARFISVPSVVMPLVFLAAVVYITAKLTGGMGLRILGSENMGGKRYIFIFGAIAGFFAMIARPVPSGKEVRYLGYFFLGNTADALSSVIPYLGAQFYFLFLIFPFEGAPESRTGFGEQIVRFWGLSMAGIGIALYIFAKYGLRSLFSIKHPIRLALVFLSAVLASSGGFRSAFILLPISFALLFCLEGLARTKYTVILVGLLIVTSALFVPLVNKLPLPIQRTVSFLPLNIDPVAYYDAQTSTEWRLQMWQQLLPEVPRYLWLGKGLGISSRDLESAVELSIRGAISSQDVAIMAGDYHSGPLSVIIPFGIWGSIGFAWFLIASTRALYLNYRYGDESLKRINSLLLAYFVARIIDFIFFFGGFYGDLAIFCGIIGLNISLNGGIRQPVRVRSVAAATAPTADLEPPMGPVPVFGRTS